MASRQLNIPFLTSVVNALPNCQLVMHRAFDHVREPAIALEELVHLGFTRILTSGGPAMAIDGLQNLRLLSDWSQGRIEILPAGGVTASNATEILAKSDARQLHGSFRNSDGMANRRLPEIGAIEQTKAILRSMIQNGGARPPELHSR